MSSGTAHRPGSQQHTRGAHDASPEAQPLLNQRGRVIQTPDTVRRMPIGLSAEVRQENALALNKLLADTITLYSLYKKCHWQVSGHTFYQLHLLFDKHADEQLALVDLIAERIQLLGGAAVGMPHDVAEATSIERPPAGVEEVPTMIGRLLKGHEQILVDARKLAKRADDNGDLGTNDLLASDVIRTNELQAWFVAEHVVDSPAVKSNDSHN